MKEQIEEMDTILREIFGCQFAYKINFEKYGGFGGHKEIYTKDIAEALYNAGYRKQEWISVDDKLPEDTIPTDYKRKTIKVLVAIKGKNGVTIRTQERFSDYTYRNDKDERTAFWTWRFSAGNVTHWMQLPEPPKMKGGEADA